MQEKLNLKNITLVALGSTRIHETKKAIEYCLKQANFDNVIFLTDKIDKDDQIAYIAIDTINSPLEYQSFKVKKMPSVLLPKLRTDYILIIDWDGFIVNADAWSDEFLEYDYIGAPFPFGGFCGNGGFSLRSKKFLQAQDLLCRDLNIYNLPEDITLSFVMRSKFKNLNCTYAPLDIAYKFATESGGYDNNMSFGFHSFLYNPQFKKLVAT
jgi:hypothetical protein